MEISNSRFDSAVSPVVGVILMVAVTVILAAVIGTFVLDLGNNVQENPQAGVTFDEDAANDAVSVQIISMENADSVTVSAESKLDINSCDGTATNEDSTYAGNDTCELTSVGQSADLNVDSAGDSVTVVGELEGKETVLQTYDYSG